MKWKSLTPKTSCVYATGAVLGVYYLTDRDIVLIDSGKIPEPELFQELTRRNLRVKAVLCTHLHPDHTANNQALMKSHSSEIYAGEADVQTVSSKENFMNEYELSNLSVAADFINRYFPSPIKSIPMKPGYINIEGISFETIPTPGHSKGHLSYVTPDGVCCVGDALLSESILASAKLPYMEDVNQAIHAMEILRETNCPFYLLAHEDVVPKESISRLVDDNIHKEIVIYNELRRLAGTAIQQENLIDEFLSLSGLMTKSPEFHRLLKRMVTSRISGLIQTGEYMLEGNTLVRV